MEAPEGFGFSWVLKSDDNVKNELLNYYKEGQWEIIFVERKVLYKDGWGTCYWVGHPLLGGIKDFKNHNTAEKYFFELIGRVHMDAKIKGVA